MFVFVTCGVKELLDINNNNYCDSSLHQFQPMFFSLLFARRISLNRFSKIYCIPLFYQIKRLFGQNIYLLLIVYRLTKPLEQYIYPLYEALELLMQSFFPRKKVWLFLCLFPWNLSIIPINAITTKNQKSTALSSRFSLSFYINCVQKNHRPRMEVKI